MYLGLFSTFFSLFQNPGYYYQFSISSQDTLKISLLIMKGFMSLRHIQGESSVPKTRGFKLTLQRESVITKNEFKSEQETAVPSNADINVVFCKPGSMKKVTCHSDSHPSPSADQALQLLWV